MLGVSVSDLALPYHQRLPSVRMQRGQVLLIAPLVTCDLPRPVVLGRLRDPGTTLAGVPVSEAPVDEDNLAA